MGPVQAGPTGTADHGSHAKFGALDHGRKASPEPVPPNSSEDTVASGRHKTPRPKVAMMTILAAHIRPSSYPLGTMNPQYPQFANAPPFPNEWQPRPGSYASPSTSTHQVSLRHTSKVIATKYKYGHWQPSTLYQQPRVPSPSSAMGTAPTTVPSHGPSFVDRGYIAKMFGAASRTYWGAVLKASPEQLHVQSISGPSPYWCINPQDHSAGTQNAGRTLDYLLDLDYVASPVVPQQLWQPLYKRAREVLVDNSRLCMPIFFVVQETGRVGLSLTEALAKKHYLLHGHNQAVNLGGKVTTHIRILA